MQQEEAARVGGKHVKQARNWSTARVHRSELCWASCAGTAIFMSMEDNQSGVSADVGDSGAVDDFEFGALALDEGDIEGDLYAPTPVASTTSATRRWDAGDKAATESLKVDDSNTVSQAATGADADDDCGGGGGGGDEDNDDDVIVRLPEREDENYIPLHTSSEPYSHSADAHTYLADQKIPALLEWLTATVVRAKSSDVLYCIRNVTASKRAELLNNAGCYGPDSIVHALKDTYTQASDSRGNENPFDRDGRPRVQSGTASTSPVRAESSSGDGSAPAAADNQEGASSVVDSDSSSTRNVRARAPQVLHLKLTYFSQRGRCDLPWILAALSGVPFEMNWTNWDDFDAIRDRLPFEKLPILEVQSRGSHGMKEETTVAETVAISRFLASLGSGEDCLLPDDPLDRAAMDSLVTNLHRFVCTIELVTAESTEVQDEAFKAITTVRLPPCLDVVERRLSGSRGAIALATSHAHGGTVSEPAAVSSENAEEGKSAEHATVSAQDGFLCGSRLCWGDLALFCEISLLFRWGATPQTLFGERHPLVRQWFTKVGQHPRVHSFVEENWRGKELRW